MFSKMFTRSVRFLLSSPQRSGKFEILLNEGKNSNPSVRANLKFARFGVLPNVVSYFGTDATKLWYCRYQTVVLSLFFILHSLKM